MIQLLFSEIYPFARFSWLYHLAEFVAFDPDFDFVSDPVVSYCLA
jgi:hypothetical protein